MANGIDADAEFGAMQTVYSALQQLDEAAQSRVLEYVSNRLGVQLKPKTNTDAIGSPESEGLASPDTQKEQEAGPEYSSLAELSDAAQPKTQSEKALVCAYWIQVCQGSDNFDSFSVNKELKNLGEGISNITSALDILREQKPALALQLKKSGKSRQARKTFKITVAGIKAVKDMIHG